MPVSVYAVNTAPRLGQTVVAERIDSLNDSDYSITIPAGKIRHYHAFAVQLSCTATVGNRQLRFMTFDPAGVGIANIVTAGLTASQVGVILLLEGVPWDGTPRTAPFAVITPNQMITTSIPVPYLVEDCVIRVWDNSAIDPAADDLYIIQNYEEWDA